jgi:hypothetical protein
MRARRLLFAATAIILGMVVALAGVELTARARGWRPRLPAVQPEPPIHEFDPILGWRPVPGHYRFGPYSPGAPPVDVTIGADGARSTGTDAAAGHPEVLLVGCSFTMGWAVSDDQTWAWRLQDLRPDVAVVNRGVGGYGTLQSLLLLEQIFARGQRPAWVLYGFLDHSLRNVGAPLWLWALAFNTHTIATPYCTLTADGRLERHPPEAYPSLPLHEYLASVALLEKAIVERRASSRVASAVTVTQRLLLEMAELCRANGVRFSAVLLDVPDAVKSRYVSYAQQHQIDVIDCNVPFLTADDVVPGEVHPNAAVHRRWGDCIAAALADPSRLPVR